MKKLLLSNILILFAFVMVACQTTEESIHFTDEQLEDAIRTEINQLDGEIYEEDVQDITEIDLSDYGIENLDGIHSLTSLENLSLQNNTIEDFSILTELAMLKEVNIVGNPSVDSEEQQKIIDELINNGVEVVFALTEETIGSADGPGGFLWKVENGNTTVYLQGTIHIGTEDFYPLNEKIEQAYADSNIVVPEVDITNINPMEMQQEMMEVTTFSDGTTIRDHISGDLYTQLDEKFQELGMPLSLLEGFQPWFLSQLVQQLMMEELDYIEGVDEYFLSRANEDGKEIIDLETVEQQLSIYADTSMEYQLEMLEASLIELEELDEQMTEMFSLYKDGDGDQLLEYLMVEDGEVTEEEERVMYALNDERNYGMTEKISGFLEDDQGDTYFVIVGALHLLLEPNIVSLLTEEGYEVEKIH